jgi:hypothetical protein
MPISHCFSMAIPRKSRSSCPCSFKLRTIVALRTLLILAAGSIAQPARSQDAHAQGAHAQDAHAQDAQLQNLQFRGLPVGSPAPVAPTRDARAQSVGMSVIPPPPIQELAQAKRGAGDGQPTRITQAKQQFVNPERAYDPNTDQSLYWDCAKKTWVDSKTNKPVGYQGGKARDGEVIPPPPKLELADSERLTSEGVVARITQAKQDADDPGRAYDPNSKQVLVWDRRQKNWIDVRTGEAVGFLGRKGVSSCQASSAAAAAPVQTAPNANATVMNDLLFKDRVAIEGSDSFSLSAAAGQAILQMELLLTSKQSVIGGGLRWVSQATPQAGAQPSAGAPAFNCLACGVVEACQSQCAESQSSRQLSKTVSVSPL